jgi:formate-dependent nitrite reductase membrane component NrfD
MSEEIVHLTQPGPYWDWQVALDLFLGGAGVGALLFAILIDVGLDGKYRRLCHTAAWLSPILVATGLALIMIKMGRPFQAYHTYLNVNLTSPLWWGGIFQPLVVVGGLAYAYLWNRPDEHTALRRRLGWALAPLTIIVGAYHGMLLSTLVAHPLWNTGPTVIAALLSFASSGIAIVMLVHLVRMKLRGRLKLQDHVATFLTDIVMVRNVLGALLVLQLGAFTLWWLDLRFGGLEAQQALNAATEAYGVLFWGLGIGVGLVLPILLGLWAIFIGEVGHRRLQIWIIGCTSVLIIIGAFFFRLTLVLGGQVPAPITSIF